MRKVVIIILALVVALSALPITFACYHGGWGHWDRFWRPNKTVIYCCPNECNVIFTYENAYDNDLTSSWEPKEVADTEADITCCGKNLAVTVTNAYPGYAGTIDFCIKNMGLYPATVNGLETVKDSPFYAQLDFTGIEMGITLQPGEIKCGQLVIHSVPQIEESQDKTFTFDITINFECAPTKCETAYAYGGCCYAHCFLYNYLWHSFTKWGWTNGPLGTGTYEFDIYAGAAQCNLSKGENIGTLFVDYDDSTVHVYYDITGSDYTMTSTHLYVGNEPWPRINGGYTVAPGQYPYSHDNLSNVLTDEYTVPACGPIYIIAHAVACR